MVPHPIFAPAAVAVGTAGFVRRQVRYHLHSEQVPDEASRGAADLWQTHPGLAMQFLIIALGLIIDSIQNAVAVDDTVLEDELDAFSPRWSRTDFEFDPRRYRR